MDVMFPDLKALNDAVVGCRRCPRLVAWREESARVKVKRFQDQEYWGKPLPGFGDPRARIVLVGLAPAAHGGNRTGRMFTGDESGHWLMRSLHGAGLANQPVSTDTRDGLRLKDCYITAAVRCAPPANKPAREEFAACRMFLCGEMSLLTRMRVVVGLGKIGFDAAWEALRQEGIIPDGRRPRFGHGVTVRYPRVVLLGTYHPSQQNTFTGTLTAPMLNAVFRKAATLARERRKTQKPG